MSAFTLSQIVDQLERHHQRATYGAVAELVGAVPRSLMQAYPKKWRYSFVVNADTGEPSGYHDLQKHPALRERETILSDGATLADWLLNPK